MDVLFFITLYPQEGDRILVLNDLESVNKRELERGYAAVILEDSMFVVFLTTRASQFIAYYLKDAPAADWIKRGVPATQKGISSWLEVN
ncbi:MAG: hypothetical protein ACKVOM_11185 [Ferruginibacter sp.]